MRRRPLALTSLAFVSLAACGDGLPLSDPAVPSPVAVNPGPDSVSATEPVSPAIPRAPTAPAEDPSPSASVPAGQPAAPRPHAPEGVAMAVLRSEAALSDEDFARFVPHDGVLRLEADSTDWADCMPGLSRADEDLPEGGPLVGFTCDGAEERCVRGGRVLLLGHGTGGLWLRAVVLYPDGRAPDADGSRVTTVVARRHRLCELRGMLSAHAPRVHPRGYATQRRDGRWSVHCGSAAQARAERDFRAHDELNCSQTYCSRRGGRDGSWFGARREDDDMLYVYASSDLHTGASEDGPLEAWRAIEARPCP